MKLVERRYLNLKMKEQEFSFWRLEESECNYLLGHSRPIKGTCRLYNQGLFRNSTKPKPKHLSVLQAFIALESLFGKAVEQVDPWKCSFTFPLLMQLTTHTESSLYVTKIYDLRGEVYFTFYKLSDRPLKAEESPFRLDGKEVEFTQGDIEVIINNLSEYFQGIYQVNKFSYRDCFLQKIESSQILYGCEDQELFEKSFECQEEYEKAQQEFQERNREELESQEARKMARTIQEIIQENSHRVSETLD